jgi:Zn-dependent M28 family amino/carboxypeptidase
MLNMDMIGRNDPKKIGVYSSRPDLVDLSCDTGRKVEFTVEPLEEAHAGSSDHAFFLEKGVPVIFYYDGGGDFAHEATDTWDQLSAEKMEGVARLCFLTVWALADQE